MVFIQILEILGSTFLAVFNAFLSLFPVYQQLGDIQDQMIAAFLGVPVIVVTIGGLLISGFKLAKRFL